MKLVIRNLDRNLNFILFITDWLYAFCCYYIFFYTALAVKRWLYLYAINMIFIKPSCFGYFVGTFRYTFIS